MERGRGRMEDRNILLFKTINARYFIFQLKMQQKCLAAGLRPESLEELKRCPRSHNSTERTASLAAAYMRFSAKREGKIKEDGVEGKGREGGAEKLFQTILSTDLIFTPEMRQKMCVKLVRTR